MMSGTGPGGQTGPVTFCLDKTIEEKQACFKLGHGPWATEPHASSFVQSQKF